MLAYQVIEVRIAACGRMLVWASWAQGAMALEVSFACRAVGREAVAIGLEEEGCKREAVFRSLMLEDLTRQVLGPGALRENRSHSGQEEDRRIEIVSL